jgi:NADPH:quinone reductase
LTEEAGMRAIRVHEFGDPDVMLVEQLPQPNPIGDEVLVRVHAVGVNPVETYIRSGAYRGLPDLPYTPGSDAAGFDVASGARVYVSGSLSGTYAEYALCRPADVHPLPDGISFPQGAALGTPYATAYRALFQTGRARPGESVLVHGASGGVGSAVVQFALAAGLSVVGTAGSDEGLDLVAELGAVCAVDHRDSNHLARAKRAIEGGGFDLVIEQRADLNLGHDLAVLGSCGRVVVVGSRGAVEVNPRDLMNVDGAVLAMLLTNASPAELAEAHLAIAVGLADGTLKPIVGSELPLADAPRAHRHLRERPALGKLVLVV